MNWIEALFGIPEEMRRPGAVAAPPVPPVPANNVPRTVPIPATPPPRPPTGATLPGGSFTPSRMPANQVPFPQQRPMQQAGGVQVAPGASQEPPQAVSASQVGPMPAAPASPLQDILTGGQPTTLRDRFRAFAAGAGNIGNTGGDPFVAFGRGLGGASQYFDSRQEAEIKNAVALRKLKLQEGKGGVSYGKTPVWGTDPETGKAVLGVIGDDGSFKKVDTSGVDLSTGIDKIDAGTHWIIKDKRNGQTIGYEPKNNLGEAFDKKLGGSLSDEYMNIQKGGQQAQSKIANLQGLRSALSGAEYTGMGAQKLLGLKKAAKALGFDVENVAAEEMASALGNQLALQLRNPSGGAGMPGAMSDKDREFLVASVPGLEKTAEGNAQLLDYMIRIEQRSVDVAQLANQYLAENDRLDAGFYDVLREWSEQNPLFEGASTSDAGGLSGTTSAGVQWSIE